MSNGESEPGDEDDVEGEEWNQDADFEEPGSDGSEADSLDQLLNEELDREGADSEDEDAAASAEAQSDFSPWLGEAPAGVP